MKLCTLITFLSLSTLSLAAPLGTGHDNHPTGSSGQNPNTNGTTHKLDETPGSGGSYNVLVDTSDSRTLDELLTEMELTRKDARYIFDNSVFRGFSANLSAHCVGKLSVIGGLKAYEPEVEVKTHDEVRGTWGLKRISQGGAVTGGDVTGFDFESYAFNGSIGELGRGVDIYNVDTGVNVNHIDFDGRATFGFAFNGRQTDEDGHGTHTAGTAASTTFGLAKAANLIAVKVLSGSSGSSSDILKGIDWMIQRHDVRKGERDFRGSVASMSLGSSARSATIDEAVRQASKAGIHFSVAAGNENQVACNSSPAGVSRGSDVLSVGAVNVRDQRSSFSNFGECVSVYAPGEAVTSTWIGAGNNVINTISGTSMACPHVTGLIAYLLSQDPSLKVDTKAMKQRIISTARKITIDKDSLTGDPGLLINNGVVKQ